MKLLIKKVMAVLILTCIPLLCADAKTVKKTQRKVTKPAVNKTTGYTVPKAKAEAFNGVKVYLPLVHYKSDLVDENYKANLAYIQNNLSSNAENTRLLFPSFIGNTLISYGIRYANRPNNVYFYNSGGNLIRIEIDNNNPETYPKRSVTYNCKGKLHAVVLYISPTEQYNFDGAGNLIVHWIGERGFNRSGKLMKIRRSL